MRRRILGRALVMAFVLGVLQGLRILLLSPSQGGLAQAADIPTGSLIVEPAAGAAPYLKVIASARHALEVNAYLLTDAQVVSALKTEARRGVEVRVIVAGNPYGDTGAVSKELSAFKGTTVQVRKAPARFEGAYTFDHAKYLVSDAGYRDGAAILGSSNLSYSGLGGGDRDYDWETSSPAVVRSLAAVFSADWSNRTAPPAPNPLVVSPGSEPNLAALIASARHRIDVETEEFGYVPGVMSALAHALSRHVAVRIAVPSDISSGDLKNVQALVARGAKAVIVRRPYIHAKLVVADGEAFIGSENFSTSSLENNREVGVVLKGTPVKRLVSIFSRDFTSGAGVQ